METPHLIERMALRVRTNKVNFPFNNMESVARLGAEKSIEIFKSSILSMDPKSKKRAWRLKNFERDLIK